MTIVETHSELYGSYGNVAGGRLVIFDNHIDLGSFTSCEIEALRDGGFINVANNMQHPRFVDSGNILAATAVMGNFRDITVVLPEYLLVAKDSIISRLRSSLAPVGARIGPSSIEIYGKTINIVYGVSSLDPFTNNENVYVEVDCDYMFNYETKSLHECCAVFSRVISHLRPKLCTLVRSCADGYMPAAYFELGGLIEQRLIGLDPVCTICPSLHTIASMPQSRRDLEKDFEFLLQRGGFGTVRAVGEELAAKQLEYFLALKLSGASAAEIGFVEECPMSVKLLAGQLFSRYLLKEGKWLECSLFCEETKIFNEKIAMAYLYSHVNMNCSLLELQKKIEYCDRRIVGHDARYNRMIVRFMLLTKQLDGLSKRLTKNFEYFPNDSEFSLMATGTKN